jgi:hypothetical protein
MRLQTNRSGILTPHRDFERRPKVLNAFSTPERRIN